MPKKVDHSERRKSFTRSAINVIAKKGLEATRLIDIAKDAGVTTGSLTHYFSDKDQLVAAALDAIVVENQDRAARSDGAIANVLAAFLPLNEEGQKSARVWLAYFGRAISNDALAVIHRQYYSEFQSQLVEQLKEEEPGVPADQRIMVADAAIAIVDGLLVRATLDPEGWPAAKQISHLQMLLNPLLGRHLPVQTKDRLEETQ